jgi:hypothetical protein
MVTGNFTNMNNVTEHIKEPLYCVRCSKEVTKTERDLYRIKLSSNYGFLGNCIVVWYRANNALRDHANVSSVCSKC